MVQITALEVDKTQKYCELGLLLTTKNLIKNICKSPFYISIQFFHIHVH